MSLAQKIDQIAQKKASFLRTLMGCWELNQTIYYEEFFQIKTTYLKKKTDHTP
jgi:hypothetical protein